MKTEVKFRELPEKVQGEEWLPVVGYEGFYEVSNFGNVRSIKRTIIDSCNREFVKKSKLRKLSFDRHGYHKVTITKGGIHKTKKVHTLVAESFLNHCSGKNGMTVDHINNKRTDNRLSNLQVISYSLNTRKGKKNKTSRFHWVSLNKQSKRWIFCFENAGFKKKVGGFETEDAAFNFGIKWLSENGYEFFVNELKTYNDGKI